jgi:hypothetical protein
MQDNMDINKETTAAIYGVAYFDSNTYRGIFQQLMEKIYVQI